MKPTSLSDPASPDTSSAQVLSATAFSMRVLAAVLASFLGILLISPYSAEAGNRVASCGGLNQVPCTIFQAVPSCDSTIPWLYENFSQNRCRALGCGGEGQSPCTVVQHIPSCNPNLYEIPLGVRCTALDGDGFPTICGGTGERPCTLAEHIPSCKPNHFEYPFPGGNCTALDSDGFPTFCGGLDEPACTVDLQAQVDIPSCKTSLIESAGDCVGFDGDAYPTNCGDRFENACGVVVQALLLIPSCKSELVEDLTDGVCYLPDDLFPVACGDPGERACTLIEHIPSCKSAAREIASGALSLPDNGWCVDRETFGAPRTTAAPAEAPPGPKSVFIVHGLNSDRYGPEKLTRLESEPFGLTTYVVDYNSNGGAVANGLGIYRDLDDDGDLDLVCTKGTRLDGFTFSLPLVSRLLAEALADQAGCRIPGFAPGAESVAIVAHSMGGLVTRDLVYRHFDELRSLGVRITDVVTLGSPHRGGGSGFPEVAGAQGTVCAVANSTPINHQICLMEVWQDALEAARRDANAGGAPFIDNLDFPEIRWTTIAAADSAAPYSIVTFPDPITKHDGLVAHVSSFSIASDLCFPAVDQNPAPIEIMQRGVPHQPETAAWFQHEWPQSVATASDLADLGIAFDYNPWNGFNLGPMVRISELPTTNTPNSLTAECHSPGPSKAHPDRSYLAPVIEPSAVPSWAEGDRFVAFPDTSDFDWPHGDLIAAEGSAFAPDVGIRNYIATVLTDGERTADVDRNGTIDSVDRNLIFSALPAQNPPAPSAYYENYALATDLDGDGFTTPLDLDVFYQAAPEPGIALGVAVGALGLASAVRKRGRAPR